MPLPKVTLLSTVKIIPEGKSAFVDWQGRCNKVLAVYPGFLSFEITASTVANEWVIVQQFQTQEALKNWRESKQKEELFSALRPILQAEPIEVESDMSEFRGGVTEVFVTEIYPNKEAEFKEWLSKVHQLEATCKGFKGMLIQSPAPGQKNWITLLQFDTLDNLDLWLASKERVEILREAEPLIANLERHRVLSPFAGWFASIAKEGTPAVWKQTMIVLLVLYPIVMLELLFLLPHLKSLPLSISNFIGNAISVALVSWPAVPLAIYFLKWWLTSKRYDLKGVIVVCLLYLLEIIVFFTLS